MSWRDDAGRIFPNTHRQIRIARSLDERSLRDYEAHLEEIAYPKDQPSDEPIHTPIDFSNNQ